jgi:HlyD family secretion protein
VAIFTLDDLDHVWLRAYVNEPDHGKIRLNERVDVMTDTYQGTVYHCITSFASPEAEFPPKTVETSADRVTLVYWIRIDIDNPTNGLPPGYAGRCQQSPLCRPANERREQMSPWK